MTTARGRWLPCSLLVALSLLVAASAPALAAPGDLDPTFGDGGLVTGPAGSPVAVALQADGRIVLAGVRHQRFGVARYRAGGALDPSFGGDGVVTTGFGAEDCTALANEIRVQTDGKIVAAGFGGCRTRFALARYLPDGSLDRTFGGDGRVRTRFGGPGCASSARGLAIQPDGKLVAVGWSDCGIAGNGPIAVIRYETDGSLDATFGDGGIVTTEVSPYLDQALDVVIQPDGKIVVAGLANIGRPRFVVVRYDASGAPDPGFGRGDGIVKTGFWVDSCRPAQAEAVAIQPDGKLVVAGAASCPNQRFALARYLPGGALDASFGGDGRVVTELESGDCFDAIKDVAVQADGAIVAVGSGGCVTQGAFGLARYVTDGSLDASFAGDGTLLTTYEGCPDAEAEGIAIQPDGKLVVGGVAIRCPGAFGRFAIARYEG